MRESSTNSVRFYPRRDAWICRFPAISSITSFPERPVGSNIDAQCLMCWRQEHLRTTIGRPEERTTVRKHPGLHLERDSLAVGAHPVAGSRRSLTVPEQGTPHALASALSRRAPQDAPRIRHQGTRTRASHANGRIPEDRPAYHRTPGDTIEASRPHRGIDTRHHRLPTASNRYAS